MYHTYLRNGFRTLPATIILITISYLDRKQNHSIPNAQQSTAPRTTYPYYLNAYSSFSRCYMQTHADNNGTGGTYFEQLARLYVVPHFLDVRYNEQRRDDPHGRERDDPESAQSNVSKLR
jgi:hypothetical protein